MFARLAIVTILSIPTWANAENTSGIFYSGNDLYPYCETNKSFVQAFVAGVFDTRHFLTSTGLLPSAFRMCAPSDAQLGQIADVVCKHMENSPELRHMKANVLASSALSNAFPCNDQ